MNNHALDHALRSAAVCFALSLVLACAAEPAFVPEPSTRCEDGPNRHDSGIPKVRGHRHPPAPECSKPASADAQRDRS